MNHKTVHITYLLVANTKRLTAMNPTEALVWKKELAVMGVSESVIPDPDWCVEQIIGANPDFEQYTIAIWAVDIA